MNYSEKLKDPRWQKKRLEILSRDNFTCQECWSTDKTLHVHHKIYKGEPWDIESKYLVTVCERCHKHISEYTPIACKELIDNLKERGFNSDNIFFISAAIAALPDDVDHDLFVSKIVNMANEKSENDALRKSAKDPF